MINASGPRFSLGVGTVYAVLILAGCNEPDMQSTDDLHPTNKSSRVNMLPEPVANEVAICVRSGFYDKEQIAEIFGEEIYEPDELDAEELDATIDDEFRKWNSEKSTWPKVTDCDRIDNAFTALSRRGIIALQNAGNTQSDGYEDFLHAYEAAEDESAIKGYCFYHSQDLERAVRGEGLYLAFGPANPDLEESEGTAIGTIIREELERAGLKVEWNGDFKSRLRVAPLLWQRR